jgi:hypothetical protein
LQRTATPDAAAVCLLVESQQAYRYECHIHGELLVLRNDRDACGVQKQPVIDSPTCAFFFIIIVIVVAVHSFIVDIFGSTFDTLVLVLVIHGYSVVVVVGV